VKSTSTTSANLSRLVPAWKGLRKSTPFFGPIRNERDYARMQALLDELLEEVGDDEDHPLADLLDVVGLLIAQYDQENGPRIEAANPQDVLKFLIDQHGLKQSDLRKEIGSQGVVSEVLAGSRRINVRQAKALAQRFGVSPAVFL
jgi:HTH-type transcriptional regulator / antitoxin HigA